MSVHWGGRGPGHKSRWSLAAGGFSPLSLFAASEPGAWYDPSDLSTMFGDSAGTTPVTATGQTVGLLLDKSKGLVLGPELVTNGDFSAGSTGWFTGAGWAIVGGQLVGTNVTGNSATTQTIPTGSGKTFLVTYTIVSITSGQVSVGIGPSLGTARSTAGTYTEYFVGTGATNGLSVYQRVSTTNAIVDNISVKEVPGNHATQPTAASRPIYGIEPFGGRRNLLTFTEQFDNAVWTKNAATVTANSTAAPDGTPTADTLTATAGTGVIPRVADISIITATSTAYTASMYVKAGTYTFFQIYLNNQAAEWANFTLTGAGTATANGTSTATITALGDGWYRCSMTYTAGGIDRRPFFMLAASGTATRAQSWNPVGTETIHIWGAQLEVGSLATAYQRVTDQWNVTETGVPSVSYLQYDGTDDWFVTPTITPGTNKVQLFAGVRKLSDATQGVLAELSATVASNNGSLLMAAPDAGTTATYGFDSKGTAQVDAVATGFTAPVTSVVTGLGDISGDSAIIRVNGVQADAETGDQGTGNYLAYPLYIGRRGGTTLPYNGRLYSLILRFGANLDAATISATETWVNGKTGAY